MNNLQDELYTIFLRSPNNLFDEFINECQKFYEIPAHTLTEMRNRDNKKIRGDIFEEFSVLYLLHVKKYKNVWLLKDVPDDIIVKLGLIRRDMGIDLIVETSDKKYMAVQCKYKKHNGFKKNILSWKVLSTFYALCLRTGPWEKYIIMTNCIYTRHQGAKTEKDLSICLKTFQNITKDEWLLMCDRKGIILNDNKNVILNDDKNVILNDDTDVIVLNDDTNVILNDDNDVIVLNDEITNKLKKKLNKVNKKLVIPTKEDLRLLRTNYYERNNLS